MPSSLSEGIALERTSGATFSPLRGTRSATLIRQRQRANGLVNQVHNVISEYWRSMAQPFRTFDVDVAILSSLCSPVSLSRIVLSVRRLYLPALSFLRWNKRASSIVSLRGKSPREWQVLATCSSTWSPPFNFNKTARSHHVVARSFEVSVRRHERWGQPRRVVQRDARNHLHGLQKSGICNFMNGFTAAREVF